MEFATYKSIIWDVMADYNVSIYNRPKLYDMIHFRSKDPTLNATSGKVQPNLLSLFVQAGGHLMLCGIQPMTMGITTSGFFQSAERYPFIFKYELEGDQDGYYSDQVQSQNFVGDRSFPYQDACLNVIDIAYPGYAEVRNRFDNGCGVALLRDIEPSTNGLREALPIDDAYPKLELRPEVADPGKFFSEPLRGLNAELYNPPYFDFCDPAEIEDLRACFQPVYGNGCLNTSSVLFNAPVAFWSSRYGDIEPDVAGGVAARCFYMGVEPYYFKPEQIQLMFDIILFEEWELPRI